LGAISNEEQLQKKEKDMRAKKKMKKKSKAARRKARREARERRATAPQVDPDAAESDEVQVFQTSPTPATPTPKRLLLDGFASSALLGGALNEKDADGRCSKWDGKESPFVGSGSARNFFGPSQLRDMIAIDARHGCLRPQTEEQWGEQAAPGDARVGRILNLFNELDNHRSLANVMAMVPPSASQIQNAAMLFHDDDEHKELADAASQNAAAAAEAAAQHARATWQQRSATVSGGGVAVGEQDLTSE
ncbi:hypothetical protein GUF51_20875, partial [Xanthomonas citri pv. citri]|nr:hypothetical protein [Xanthomonas citri pv. citri]